MEWAQNKHTLGLVYAKLARGNQQHNNRQALVCYEEALSIYTALQMPAQVSNVQRDIDHVRYVLSHGRA
ncbi:hypothetical protein [Dictyobacter kobayashii]|uniref:hypothetical protein n=1 Tax=Dictyobacter kobayashii TaxID=2014872 RepID=UPI001386B522|nr:hypothetical protein [Dictyobacter kobayashii]